MAFVEYTSESWGSRLVKSIGSVAGGLFLFVIAFPLLFWNEGRAVQTAKSLTEGAASVKTVPADKVDSTHEGKLVHMNGESKVDQALTDPLFGISASAIRLSREVEMYQWRETKKVVEHKKLGGGVDKETTYDYERIWSASAINSENFKQQKGHGNPEEMPYPRQDWVAEQVRFGAFTLSEGQIDQLHTKTPIPVESTKGLNRSIKAKIADGGFYVGVDPSSPRIGDVRVSFSSVMPGPLSLVGVQSGQSFSAWPAPSGDKVLLVQTGTLSAAQMFQNAQDANVTMTWILRVIGFACMFFGLMMAFKPIAVLGDVVPLVGSLLAAGLGVFAFLLSSALSVVTIGIAWLVYRPLVGILLLLVSGGALYLLAKRGAKAVRDGKTAKLSKAA